MDYNTLEIVFWIVIVLFYYIRRLINDNRNADRARIERELAVFTLSNEIKSRLVNNYCELRLWDRNVLPSMPHDFILCCREKTDGKRPGRIFFLTGQSDHTATVWAVFNMSFTKKSNYNSMKSLYRTMKGDNWSVNLQGYSRYSYEQTVDIQENRSLYKKLLPSNMAENEFCRMQIFPSGPNDFVIVCTNIWDISENPEKFTITGIPDYLYKILDDFKEKKHQFETFYQLKKKFSLKPKEQLSIRPETEEILPSQTDVVSNADDADDIIELDIPKNDERKIDI